MKLVCVNITVSIKSLRSGNWYYSEQDASVLRKTHYLGMKSQDSHSFSGGLAQMSCVRMNVSRQNNRKLATLLRSTVSCSFNFTGDLQDFKIKGSEENNLKEGGAAFKRYLKQMSLLT